jgi:FtsZ-interacting cell division protein ZipA
MARPTSSAKPAIVVAVLLLGAAGAGYMKLQSDTQALLADKDASIRRVEEARVQAVDEAAKAERQALAKLKACEAKTEATSAAARTTPAAPAAAAAVAPASFAASTQASSRGRHKPPAGRHAAAGPSAAPAPSPEHAAVPRLPGKKRLDNDPLAGIKI